MPKTKILVSIAITAAEDLEPLPGTVTAAQQMVAWGKAAGYESHLFSDREGDTLDGKVAALDVATVKDTLSPILQANAGNIEHLILHFAGHGFLKGAGRPIFLMTKWASRGNEAVDMTGLRMLLQFFMIDASTIIYDACSGWNNSETEFVDGVQILDRGEELRTRNQNAQITRFSASIEGKFAYMMRGNETEAPICLFSCAMLQAMTGDGSSGPLKFAELRKFATEDFRLIAAKYRLDQAALVDQGLFEPHDTYAELPLDYTPLPLPEATEAIKQFAKETVATTGGAEALPRQIAKVEETAKGRGRTSDRRYMLPLEDRNERLLETRRRAEPAETTPRKNVVVNVPSAKPTAKKSRLRPRARRNIAGRLYSTLNGKLRVRNFKLRTTDLAITAYEKRRESFDNLKDTRLDTPFEAPRSCLLHLPGGNSVPFFLYYELSTTIWLHIPKPGFSDGHRALFSRYYFEYQDEPTTGLAKRMILFDKVATNTMSEDATRDHTISLREEKRADPVSGALAASLAFSIGDIDTIRRIAWFYAEAGEPIPFDVALLGDLMGSQSDGTLFVDIPATPEAAPLSEMEAARRDYNRATSAKKKCPVAGQMPLLQDGWSMLEFSTLPLHPALHNLAPHVISNAVMTTFKPDGTTILEDLILKGEI